MANAAGDAHEFPIYGYHFRVTFPILDNTGSLVTGAAGLDSEFSNDAGTFADCTNEATEIATSSGIYYLDLIGTEMDAKQVAVIVKTSTSNAKTTTLILYPERLIALATGTAQAGAASTITLAASTSKVDNDLAGLYVGITNNGAAGSQYQVRKIISNVASTQVATVDSAWGTNPSSASTYELLSRSTANVSSFAGTLPPTIATAGVPDVNTIKLSNAAQTARDIGASVLLSSGTGTGQLKLASGYVAMTWADIAAPTTTVNLSGTTIATTQKVDVETIKTNPVVNAGTITFPTTATLASTTNITAAAGCAVSSIGANVITAAATAADFDAEIATAIWTDTTAGDFTTALSVGKSIMNGVSLGTGLTVAAVSGAVGSVTGAVGSVTGAVGSVTGNVGGNVTGSVGSVAAGGITAASIADAAIDRATFAADTGLQTIRSNTAQAGGATSITLDASASAVDSFYVNCLVFITGGTGVGQSRFITAYVGATKVATVAAWVTNPDNTSTFAILPFDSVPGATAPSTAQIVTAIMTDLLSGTNYNTSGSFGKLIKDDIDATISSRGTSTLTQTQVSGGAYALNSSSFAFNAALDFTTAQKAATLARVTLTDTVTTYTGNTVQTGDSFARIGATGSGLTSLAPSATALSTAQWTNTLATNLGTLAGHDPGATLASQTNITAATGIDVTKWAGTTVTTPNTAGTPVVDVGRWRGVVPETLSVQGDVKVDLQSVLGNTTSPIGLNTAGLDYSTHSYFNANVTAMAADVITAAAIAADAGTEIGTAAWASATRTLTSGAGLTVAAVSGAVGSVTGNVSGNVVGTVAGVTPATTAGILATALTEGYATDGAAFTLTQAVYQIWSLLAEKSVSGTTMTCKKLDGSTTSMTLTLNSSTDPSSITRAS